MVLKGGEPNISAAAKILINDYCRGKLPFYTKPPGCDDEPQGADEKPLTETAEVSIGILFTLFDSIGSLFTCSVRLTRRTLKTMTTRVSRAEKPRQKRPRRRSNRPRTHLPKPRQTQGKSPRFQRTRRARRVKRAKRGSSPKKNKIFVSFSFFYHK